MNQQDQQKMKAHRNQQLLERETAFALHYQKAGDSPKAVRNENENLMCACTGQKCEGICRTTHLHRPRYANPKRPKSKEKINSAIRISWTNPSNQCPEAYIL